MTEFVGVFDQWRNDTSTQLVTIDKESQEFWKLVRPSLRVRVRHRWYDFKFTIVASFLRFCELANRNDLFYPLYCFCLYISIGPWFIGEFVSRSDNDGTRFGWLMVYGLWFQDGTWEPVLDTWLYAWYGLCYTVFPLVIYLSFTVTLPKLLYSPLNNRLRDPIHSRWYIRVFVMCCMLYHTVDTISMCVFYGTIATVLSPGKTWILVWAYYVFYKYQCFVPPKLKLE